MIHWGAERLLWLLVLVPVLAALLVLGAWLKRRALRQLADPLLVPRLTDSRSPRWALVKVVCVLSGLVLMIVAAARPQWGEKLQVVKGRGIDIVIALDASRSMLATDIAPSRLARAKTQIASLLDNLSGNRVGIIAFAGSAQVMCPLTTDVEAAKLFRTSSIRPACRRGPARTSARGGGGRVAVRPRRDVQGTDSHHRRRQPGRRPEPRHAHRRRRPHPAVRRGVSTPARRSPRRRPRGPATRRTPTARS
jgi:hypothetical protein